MTPNVSFISSTPPSIPFSRDGQENKVSPFFVNLCYVMISRKRNYTGWYGKHLVMLCYFKCVSRFIPFCFSSVFVENLPRWLQKNDYYSLIFVSSIIITAKHGTPITVNSIDLSFSIFRIHFACYCTLLIIIYCLYIYIITPLLLSTDGWLK